MGAGLRSVRKLAEHTTGPYPAHAPHFYPNLVPFVRREVLAKLKPLRVPRCSFANLPDPSPGRWGSGVPAEEMAKMQWTKPEVVAQIRFVEWTADNRLRHAAFLGLRFDKSAGEVQRES
jgi:ATP-dependent DNA ligase